MNAYYEVIFWCARVVIALGAVGIVWGLGLLFYERFIEGDEDAFEAERRTGPADRRARPHTG